MPPHISQSFLNSCAVNAFVILSATLSEVSVVYDQLQKQLPYKKKLDRNVFLVILCVCIVLIKHLQNYSFSFNRSLISCKNHTASCPAEASVVDNAIHVCMLLLQLTNSTDCFRATYRNKIAISICWCVNWHITIPK